MGGWRGLFGVVGVLATVLAAGLLLAPERMTVGPLSTGVTYVERAGTSRILLLTGCSLVAYLLIAVRTPKPTQEEADIGFTQQLTERDRSEYDSTVTGGDLDATIGSAVENGGDELAEAQRQLRRTARSVYADRYATSLARADQAIDSGEWCRDPIAAAFLAGETGPSMQRKRTVRLLLFPERERQLRIERTIGAIEGMEYHG